MQDAALAADVFMDFVEHFDALSASKKTA
jgi:hypothetical protein